MKVFPGALSIAALIGLSACEPAYRNAVQNESSTVLDADKAEGRLYDSLAAAAAQGPQQPGAESTDTTVDVRFEEFGLGISGIEVFDKDSTLDKVQKDSVYLYCELGYSIEGKTIRLPETGLDSLEVTQYYQTSITVQGEGPHCDLLGWKHYYSTERPLTQTGPGQFLFNAYTQEQARRFPPVKIREVKEQVKSSCGEGWYRSIQDIRSVTEYPCDVGISFYFIRIKGTVKSTHKKFSKLIAIESPLGC